MPLRIGMNISKLTDGTGERDMRQKKGERDAGFSDNRVPPIYTSRALAYIVITQAGIQCRQSWRIDRPYVALFKFKNRICCRNELMIIVNSNLSVTTLYTGIKKSSGIG